jgi:hypothetical protein
MVDFIWDAPFNDAALYILPAAVDCKGMRDSDGVPEVKDVFGG